MESFNLSSLIISLLVGLAFAALGIAHARRRKIDLETFIAFRNSTTGGVAMTSLVASLAGAWILFSPAETGTWAGLPGIIGYGVGQGMPILLLIIFGARLRRLMPEGYSLSGFIHRRYGALMGRFTAVLMVFYMFTFLTAELTGIAQAYSLISGLPLLVTAAVVMALTLSYTVYGGLRSSIFTDFFQFTLLVPLLLILFAITLFFLGGPLEVLHRVEASQAQLLNPFFQPGMEFAVVLIIGISASNLFHQGLWQRVYACKNERVMRRAFLAGGLTIIPLIALSGMFGIMAAGQGLVREGEASVALFTLLRTLPPWVLLLTLLLGLVLVMSSIDTLINGIVSILVVEGKNAHAAGTNSHPLRRARILTLLIALLAVAIASRGYSVLYLFLLADLICSAVVAPTLFGLYGRYITGRQAVAASAFGLIAGALFFPKPDFTSWNGLPASMFISFSLALLLSTLLSVLFNRLGRHNPAFAFDSLSS